MIRRFIVHKMMDQCICYTYTRVVNCAELNLQRYVMFESLLTKKPSCSFIGGLIAATIFHPDSHLLP